MPSGMLTEPSSEIPRPSGATCSAAKAAASRVFFGTTEQLADKLAEADSSPLKQFGMTKNEGSVAQVTRPCSNRFQTRIFPQLVKECAGHGAPGSPSRSLQRRSDWVFMLRNFSPKRVL